MEKLITIDEEYFLSFFDNESNNIKNAVKSALTNAKAKEVDMEEIELIEQHTGVIY